MIRNSLALISVLFFAVTAQANYTGSETQYFNPTAGNLDFFTVHSSRMLPKGTMKTTLFFDYAKDIHYGSSALENNAVQAQLGFALGLTDRLSFSVAGQGFVSYDDEAGGKYTTEDITYLRTGLKYQIYSDDNSGMAMIVNLGFGLMDPDYFVGDENDFGGSITFAYDRMLSERMRFAANLGYRLRNSEDRQVVSTTFYNGLPSTRDGSDVLASVAMNYMFNQKWTGVAEIYASLPTDQLVDFTVDAGSYDQKGAELLLGANYKFCDKMDIGFGAVYGLLDEAQNADYRIFLGMGYHFGGAHEDAAFMPTGSASAPAPVDVVKAPPIAKAKTVAIEDEPVKKSFIVTAKFPSGSAVLSAQSREQLRSSGKYLKDNDFKMVFVEGHSDSQGNDSYNKILSERRAQSVKNQLVREYGIDKDKIKAIGYGETNPIADNGTADGRAKNRRVVINIK
jgi:outer membrane protein OmpA-like peptidoglycan-associated protein